MADSNPSSEVSIEDLGPEVTAQEEAAAAAEAENAQEIITDDTKGPRDEVVDEPSVAPAAAAPAEAGDQAVDTSEEEKKDEEEKIDEEGEKGLEESDANRSQNEAPAAPAAEANPEENIEEINRAIERVVLGSGRAPEIFTDSEDEDDDDDDIKDETILERISALSEMFPEALTHGISDLSKFSVSSAKWLASTARQFSWVFFSSSFVLFMPVAIESERLSMAEMEKQHTRQVLLGPGAGAPPASTPGGAPPPM